MVGQDSDQPSCCTTQSVSRISKSLVSVDNRFDVFLRYHRSQSEPNSRFWSKCFELENTPWFAFLCLHFSDIFDSIFLAVQIIILHGTEGETTKKVLNKYVVIFCFSIYIIYMKVGIRLLKIYSYSALLEA
jgi:hypothetical protein